SCHGSEHEEVNAEKTAALCCLAGVMLAKDQFDDAIARSCGLPAGSPALASGYAPVGPRRGPGDGLARQREEAADTGLGGETGYGWAPGLLGPGELAALGLGEPRFFALLADFAQDGRVERGRWRQALGRGPVALLGHLRDHFRAGQRLARFFQHAGGG